MMVKCSMMLVMMVVTLMTRSRLVTSLTLTTISVPLHPQVGDIAVLRCDFDLQGDRLYSVKWYKDNTEFYRYLPLDHPPSKAFPVLGTQVLLQPSDDRSVHLTNISLDTSGLYQCEVSTEAPKFKTVASDDVVKVVQPSSSPPRLDWANRGSNSTEAFNDHYGARVGDRLRIKCISHGSFPAASLKFYINDEIANDKNIRTISKNGFEYKSVLKSSRKELDIVLERRHFRYGDLTIKCTSDIYDIYFQSSTMTFVGVDLGEMALGRHTINSGEKQFISSSLNIIIGLMFIKFKSLK